MASIVKEIEKVGGGGGGGGGPGGGSREGRGEKGKFASWDKPNVKLFECKRDEN